MSAAISRPYRVAASAQAHEHVLATVRFGAHAVASEDPCGISVALPLLAGPAEECWLSSTPVQSGWQQGVGYAENGEVLLGQVRITGRAIAQHGMSEAAFEAYTRIQQSMQSRGYPQALRLWNFIPHILEGEGDAECYRLFNVGRARALEHWPEEHQQLPAATAIGTPQGDLLVYVLAAARVSGIHAENPRQLPAVHYPRQYGSKSPNFARATRMEWADGGDLLVSGTASVVGHETRHAGDVLAQFDELVANLTHLVAHAAHERGGGRYFAQGFKLYLKHAEHLPLVLPRLNAAFGDVPVTCLHGTICRHDLLVEVEGIYKLAASLHHAKVKA